MYSLSLLGERYLFSKLILEALGFQKKPLTVCHACIPASGFDGDIEPCRMHQ